MTVVLWLLAALVLLPLLLLAVPAHVEARGRVRDADVSGGAWFRWGWWALRVGADSERGVEVRVFGVRVWRPGKGRREPDAPRQPERRRARRSGRRRSLRAVLGALRRVGPRLARTVRVRGQVAGTVGLGDPATTGLLFGVLAVIGPRLGAALDVRPAWVDDTVSLDGELWVRNVPLHTLAVAFWCLVTDGEARRALLGTRAPSRSR